MTTALDAQRAKELLNDATLNQMLEDIDAEAVKEWRSAPDVSSREAAYQKQKAIASIRDHLRRLVENREFDVVQEKRRERIRQTL